MTFKSWAAIGASLLFFLPGGASAQGAQNYSLRNDVGHAVTCGIRRAGSSAVDAILLRPGETWTKSYSGSKTRLLLCEGAYSISRWQTLAPDRQYRLVKDEDQQVVARLVS
jgi:hypothetical protein